MKNYLIILLLLIFGITGTYYNPPKSIKYGLLIDKDGLKYDPNTKQLYTGKTLYDLKKEINHWFPEIREGIFEGYYKDGLKDGLWTYWYKNGVKKREGTFKDGLKDGLWTYRYKNGYKRCDGTFKDGKEDGIWTYWKKFPIEQKKGELTFKNGEKVSEKCWDKEGNEYEK